MKCVFWNSVHNDPSRSSKVVYFSTNRKSIYWSSIVTSVLFCRISEIGAIRAFVRRKPLFPYPTLIPAKISGCSPWRRSVMLGRVAKSEHPELTDREIIFEEFQHRPTWSRYLNVMDRQTDGRTDRQTTCRGNTALYVASRVNIRQRNAMKSPVNFAMMW